METSSSSSTSKDDVSGDVTDDKTQLPGEVFDETAASQGEPKNRRKKKKSGTGEAPDYVEIEDVELSERTNKTKTSPPDKKDVPSPITTSFSNQDSDIKPELTPIVRTPSHLDFAAAIVASSTAIIGPTNVDSVLMKEMRMESFDPNEQDLHELAKDGEDKLLVKVLERMSKTRAAKRVNKRDQDRYSPLHYAVRYCHLDTCKALCNYGADIHIKGEDGVTAMHIVAKFKPRKDKGDNDEEDQELDEDDLRLQDLNLQVLQFLLTQGSRVNEKDFYGLTPLHHAAMRGNYQCARVLVQHPDIDIEATDRQSMTPLHVSSVYGHVDIFNLLVDANANIRCRDEDNGTPLQFAAAEGNLEIVRLILKTIKQNSGQQGLIEMLNEADNDGSTPLHLGISNGHYDVTKEIVDCALSYGHVQALNAKMNNRETPLHLAARHGHLEITTHLLEKGAAIDMKDENFATPLILAAQHNHHQVVEYLIQQGANIESHDLDNFTPLLIAANYGHTETISVLLRYKANVTAQDKSDKTVLYQCAEENRPDALKIFLKTRKAKKLIGNTDRYDNTPLHIAACEGHLQIVKILLEANAEIDTKNEDEQTPLHLAADRGHVKIVQILVKTKKDIVHDDDENGDTPLHLAALKGRTNCVRELVRLGASIRARNAKQWTPLDCCAYAGMRNSAAVLLENDAPVDPKDKRRITPLHLACQEGHEDLVELLLKWKADVSHCSGSGKNALDFAVDNGHQGCARVIIQSEFWRDAMKNRNKGFSSDLALKTPMRKLIKKMPQVAEEVFLKCMSTNGKNPEDYRYQVYFDYEFLDDEYSSKYWLEIDDTLSEASFHFSEHSDKVYDEEGKLTDAALPYISDTNILQENHPLNIMVKSKRTNLLRHPLVVSLINLKWKLYGRYFYYASLLHLLTTLVFLNAYMLTTPPPYLVNASASTDSKCVIVVDQVQSVWGSTCNRNYYNFQSPGQVMILIFAGIGLAKEAYQLFTSGLVYFRSLTNIVELPMYTLAILLVVDFGGLQYDGRENWQWQCGAVAMLFTWLALLLNIQNLPRFGLYVVMFSDVLRSFLSFAVIFFLFIFGFAFTFHVLLQNQYTFSYWWLSLVKTFIMMIGEFEYDTIFVEQLTNPTDSLVQVNYDALTYIVFIIFTITMSIIIMNLLVGLAVDDIKEVQNNAELTSLAMQVKLTLDVEYILPKWIRRRFMRKYRKFKPNKFKKSFGPLRWYKEEEYLDRDSLSAAFTSEKTGLENVESRVGDVEKKVKDLKTSVGKLREQTKNVLSVAEAIAKKLEVEDWNKNQDDRD